MSDQSLTTKQGELIEAAPIQTPAQLLELAISKDLDIEKLERLMELQERWEEKQAKAAFLEALSKFQSICPEILKTKDGYNSKYAPLGKIARAIKAPLYECGLSYRWEQEDAPELITVYFILSHVNGHSEKNHLNGAPDESGKKNPLQERMSTISYLRRYTLSSGLGISTADIDDDGCRPEPTITKEEVANLEALIDEVKANKPNFLKYLKIEKLENLSVSKYARAVKALEDKRK